ncbi:MAG: hypothetical protein HFI34_12395 [Lachnospiraceae bacterium]|nr:hypothetical protein [Lachnospiraceae bacterium]
MKQKFINYKKIRKIIIYLPIITNALEILIGSFFKVINLLSILICLIIAIIVLENQSSYELKYVSFFFQDGTKLDRVLNERISKKGNWVIVMMNQEMNFDLNSIKYVK